MSLLRRRTMMESDKLIYFNTKCENGTFFADSGKETTGDDTPNNRARTMDKIMLNAGKYLLNAEGVERGSVFKWNKMGSYVGFYPSVQTILPIEFVIDKKTEVRCVFSHLDNSIVDPSIIKNIILRKIG